MIVTSTPQDTRNLQFFSGWCLVTALTFIAATILIGEGFIEPGPLAWAITATAIFFSAMAVRAYVVFMRHADELLRKIQLEGLALGFGAGVIFMLGYRLLERLGAPKLDIADGVLPMMIFWTIGQYLGYRRYWAAEEEQ